MQPLFFETSIYTNVEEEPNDPTWFFIILGCFAFLFVLSNSTAYFNFIFYLFIGYIIFNFGVKYFIYQKLNFSESGILKISETTIYFNNVEIKWESIKQITIDANDYYNKYIYRQRGDNRPVKSLGLNNTIIVLSEQGQSYYYFFKLNSKQEYDYFKNCLWVIVQKEYFSLENAKNIIHPQNYKEHQELKKYCKT